ncbi:pyridoxamine 5'-phosphate oxidase family protein [Rathayibacter soli]|uniref:pyridoxamine 5'-phosphate oxidase family protein n=1 Tax=Rathayibacter soli TaxID=3144168 RepID=UPI0027E3B8DD|nr:pyridoxamine 5'-phosphate oxidase family protein [Glaciibacter superstes]
MARQDDEAQAHDPLAPEQLTPEQLAPEQFAPEELTPEECWRLLASADFGRLATAVAHPDPRLGTSTIAVDIVPVNFRVNEREILFRSGPGGKLMNLTANHAVAFEVDGLESDGPKADGPEADRYWSVVVHGTAKRMSADHDIESSGVLDVRAAHPTPKWNYVRITPESITGIRFRRS